MTNILETEEMAVLSVPHQVFLADRILRLDVGAFTSSITLGNPVPNGTVMPAVTITLPTDRLFDIAHGILSTIGSHAKVIEERHATFQERITPRQK